MLGAARAIFSGTTFTRTHYSTFCRYLSQNHGGQHSEVEIQAAKAWLANFSAEKVPKHLFDVSYSRASGPGGQKVNKTSSKATVSLSPDRWLNPDFCYWIPPAIRSQLTSKKLRYETKSGGILLQSDSSRNREVNTAECFRKLIEEIKNNSHFAKEMEEEDIKKWEELKEESREKRLFHKKRQSDKKKSRSKKFDL
ncbi:Piso0_002180 [Millerozyma farinosa CBS 7064]|uniref:Piso0_002180 protein n=1 Tax=Pichia sorbitophila (strain ATCC MYA-4447 / BCRC 22081 / CBS 7064 / NBRC 10061 / NRRL Y-12695) TaxID=559304 RepID=G8YEC2_PICSO|nr:Piso0_002180 [Millerozyma farinosa CBS 7064]